MTPEILRILGDIVSALDLPPELRDDLYQRVPAEAEALDDLPDFIQELYADVVKDADKTPDAREEAASFTTLTLAGRPVIFHTERTTPQTKKDDQ